MKTCMNNIIYRGFHPRTIRINYAVKKPKIIYRGFTPNAALSLYHIDKTDCIYRGIKLNKGGEKAVRKNEFIFEFS